jgi:hypothetical protein
MSTLRLVVIVVSDAEMVLKDGNELAKAPLETPGVCANYIAQITVRIGPLKRQVARHFATSFYEKQAASVDIMHSAELNNCPVQLPGKQCDVNRVTIHLRITDCALSQALYLVICATFNRTRESFSLKHCYFSSVGEIGPIDHRQVQQPAGGRTP